MLYYRHSMLNEIEARIVGLKFGSDADPSENAQFIEDIGSPDGFSSLIGEILEKREALENIASRSYRHVNHFDKIVLFDDENPGHARLTLHLWRPPYTVNETQDELIHDHRFSFWSKVLCGSLRSEVFERTEEDGPDTQLYRSFSYCPETADIENFYNHQGDVRLKVRRYQQTDRDQGYYLKFDTIHRICLPERQAVSTIVLRSPRLRDHSTVYNTVYPATDVRVRNTFFSPEDVAERLDFLRSEILEGAQSITAETA